MHNTTSLKKYVYANQNNIVVWKMMIVCLQYQWNSFECDRVVLHKWCIESRNFWVIFDFITFLLSCLLACSKQVYEIVLNLHTSFFFYLVFNKFFGKIIFWGSSCHAFTVSGWVCNIMSENSCVWTMNRDYLKDA